MNSNLTIPKRFPSQVLDRTMDYPDPTTIKMMIQLELEFNNPLDPERLARAVDLAMDAEPVLGCRFVSHWRKPFWERVASNDRNAFISASNGTEFESFKVSSINAHIGPQIRVCLWNSPCGARLLIKVAHYVADAAGVKDASKVISSIYSRLSQDPNYRLEPNLTGSRGVYQVLRAVPWHKYPSLFLKFLQDNSLFLKSLHDRRALRVSRDTQTLPIPEGPPESLSFIHRLLSKEKVSLLSEYGKQCNATINDMLLTAFFRALAQISNWDGHKTLQVNTTIDLRRYMVNGYASAVTNLSETVNGCPSLGTDLGQDFSSTLKKVTSIIQQRKKNFMGVESLIAYLVLCGPLPHRWVTKMMGRIIQKLLIHYGNFPHTLTNMGSIDPVTVTFGSKPFMARFLPPPISPPSFAMAVSGYDGTLTLSSGVYDAQGDIADHFLDAMVNELPG